MDFPKPVYDDFYKFLTSLGFILFMTSLGVIAFIKEPHQWFFIILFIISIFTMGCAGGKWYKNQQLLDAKLKSEVALIEHRAQEIEPREEITDDETEARGGVAIVDYKIASVLPKFNTILFDFLKSWKVWFLIKNHEKRKYKAYIKIKFISDDYEEEVSEGYYGGTRAWNLNALSTIIAPGLGIPERIREKARQRKRIEIRIFCTIKDEHDELIEEKLPAGYVYEYENNSWYYEP